MSNFWSSLGYFVLGAVVSAIITFIVVRKMFEKQQRENPPITEKQIRAMYLSMGRKPSEADIRKVMKSIKQ